MSDGIDPFHVWLGIPPPEQPADHYRLLSLERFEGHPQVVANAADRASAFVASHAQGPHAAVAQKVLAEIAHARDVLLTPAKKAAYDATLTARPSVPPAFAPPGSPAVSPPVAPSVSPPGSLPQAFAKQTGDAPAATLFPANPQRDLFPPRPSSASPALGKPSPYDLRKSNQNTQRVLLGAAFAICMIGLALYFTFGDEVFELTGGTPFAPPPKPKLNPLPRFPPSYFPPDPQPVPEEPGTPEYDYEQAFAPEEASDAGMAAPVEPVASRRAIDLAGPTPSGEWIDLLEWSEGIDWSPRGYNWSRFIDGVPTRHGLSLRSPDLAKLPLPVWIHGNYELAIEFTRTEGNDNVGLTFPVGPHNVALDFGADEGAYDGVNEIDHVWARQGNPTTRRPSRAADHARHIALIRVEHSTLQAKFQVALDDAPDYIVWEGRPEQLTGSRGWDPMSVGQVWLGSWKGGAVFHSVKLRMLSGTAAKQSVTRADRRVDLERGLVRLVAEPARDVHVGHFRLSVDQMPEGMDASKTPIKWPLVAPQFRYCRDFYGAHAPSKLTSLIPEGAKSFSVLGLNDSSRETKFQASTEEGALYASGASGREWIRVDLPPGAKRLELTIDDLGSPAYDRAYWCYPRYHDVPAAEITDAMLDADEGALKFTAETQTSGQGAGGRNVVVEGAMTPPVDFRDAVPVDEFLFAHAPSQLTYVVPEGMTRFTAVGWSTWGPVKFAVDVNGERLFTSDPAGVVPIEVKLPPDAQTITLRVDELGDYDADQAMWCYPRLHRE